MGVDGKRAGRGFTRTEACRMARAELIAGVAAIRREAEQEMSGSWRLASVHAPYVGFGSLEELIEDAAKDECAYVRVDTLVLEPRGVEGVVVARYGVFVSTYMAGEIKYAFVLTGTQQIAGGVPLGGGDVLERTMEAKEQIIAWLGKKKMPVRPGSYSLPTDLRLMMATAECAGVRPKDEN